LSTHKTFTAVLAAAVTALAVGGCAGHHSAKKPSAGLAGPQKASPVEIGQNIVRIPGLSSGDIAASAVLTAYDPGEGAKPRGFVLVRDDDWRSAVLAAQFASSPVNAAVLPVKKDYIPTGPGDVLARIKPSGFPKAKGLETMVLGKLGSDVFLDLQDDDLKLTNINKPAAELALSLVPFRGGWARKYSDSVMVVSSEARDYALPAAAWSAFSGDTIAFVTRNQVPQSTIKLLVQRKGLRLRQPTIYVVGPKSVVSDSVVSQLGKYGPVKRIAGKDAVETSVAFARYHDRETGFGWGVRRGPATVSIVNPNRWADAIGAFTFAATGPRAPLLLAPGGSRMPKPVTDYIAGLRGKQPNQAFVFANDKTIDSPTVGAIDGLLTAAR
jgi:hypothetical protein